MYKGAVFSNSENHEMEKLKRLCKDPENFRKMADSIASLKRTGLFGELKSIKCS